MKCAGVGGLIMGSNFLHKTDVGVGGLIWVLISFIKPMSREEANGSVQSESLSK